MEWVKWVFSGVGVVILSVFSDFKKKKNTGDTMDSSINNNTSSNVVNINLSKNENNSNNDVSFKPTGKENIQVLFVDDEKFKIVEYLKKAGVINTKTIKDIENLDRMEVRNAHIIFVDINGVGEILFPKDKGLGLAEALKKKYPNKYIVIYSAQEQGDRFHKALKTVDYTLPKNAEPYEFINVIENYLS